MYKLQNKLVLPYCGLKFPITFPNSRVTINGTFLFISDQNKQTIRPITNHREISRELQMSISFRNSCSSSIPRLWAHAITLPTLVSLGQTNQILLLITKSMCRFLGSRLPKTMLLRAGNRFILIRGLKQV